MKNTTAFQSQLRNPLTLAIAPIDPMAKHPAATEPFPALSATTSRDSADAAAKPPRRRPDSALRGDPQGDTSAPALATMYDQSSTGSSPAVTPVRLFPPLRPFR